MGMYDDILGAGQSTGGAYDDILGETKPKKEQGIVRGIADLGVGFASGAVGATKAMADAAGAGGSIASGLDDANKFVSGYLSDSAKADQQRQSEILKESEGKGIVDRVISGGKAFGVAPLQTAVTGLGSIVPILAGSAATALTGGGAPAALAVGAGLGATMGAGTVKGAIYDEVKQRGIAAGLDENTAAAEASKAQEYTGGNAGNIALGAGLGAADAATGVSKIAGNMLRNAIVKPSLKEAAQASTRGIVGRTATGIASEVPLEAAQGGQEKYAANVAAQRAGYDADPWAGVVEQGTFEGLASAGPGAMFGAFNGAKYVESKKSTDKPQETPTIPPNVSLTADPIPVQQRIDAMLGLDTNSMDDNGRALYEKDLSAAFNEPIGTRIDENKNKVPYTIGEYLDSQVRSASAKLQATDRLNQLADEEAQQHAAITQDLVQSAAQGGALSKAALTGIQTGATQMPVHPERAAIEQQMLADEAAQAELAPIERLMRTRSDEQVQRIAENENANPKMRQVAIADLQRRMETKAQQTTTIPLQQTATQLNMPAQNGIKQLQAQLEQTEPFTEQSSALTEKLQSAVTQDAQSVLNAGEMPVYKVTDHVSVAIHPSAQNPGMVQVTRYTKDGVIGDSQYNNVDDAVRQEGLTHKPRIASNEAVAVIEKSIQAESEYQQRKSAAPVPNADAGIGVGGITRKRSIENWTADELQARLNRADTGESPFYDPESRGKIEAELAKRPARKAPVNHGLSVGKAPNSAAPVTVRNGVIFIGDEPAVNYDTEQDIKIANDATPRQIVDALKSGGAIATSQRFYGLPAEPKAEKQKPDRRQIDATKDTLFQAIAKLGGMDTQELTSNGFDQKDISVRHNGRVIQSGKNKGQLTKPSFKSLSLGFNMPLHKKGGMSFDGVLEELKQHGYFPEDATKNDAIEAFRRELGDDAVMTPDAAMQQAEMQAEQEANDAIGYDDMSDREKALVDFHAENIYDEDNPIEAFKRGMKRDGATEDEINEAIKQTFGAQETGNNDSGGTPQGTGETRDAQGADDGRQDGEVQEGAEPDWLTGQTNEQAAAELAKRKADIAEEKRQHDELIAQAKRESNAKEKARRAAQVLAEREAAKKAEVDKAAEDFALGQEAPAPVERKVTTEDARGQRDVFAQAKYAGPADVSSRAGQMELSNRAGTIAALKGMNEQLRKIAPDEAWADRNIEDAQNLDALRDQISQALVDANRGKPDVNPLRKELEELSGQELKDVFSKLNLAGKLMAYEERISALLMEDAAEVRAAISAVTGNPSESTAQPVKATTEAKAVEPAQDSDWLGALFNQGTATAEEDTKAVAQAIDKSARVDAAIAMLTGEIEATNAVAAELVARKYKSNRKQIELVGDGPGKNGSMSISAINESRRRRSIEAAQNTTSAMKKAIEFISENPDDAFKQVLDMESAVTKQFNEGFFGKSAKIEDQLDMAVGSLIGASQYSGKGSAGRKLRMAAHAYFADDKPAAVDAKKEAETESSTGDKIEDFGEKIAGAKKDLWQSYKKAMSDELPEDAKDITLSKHFPEPDYENLIASGTDIHAVAAIKAMRDEIPAKPRQPFRLRRWAEQLKTLREFSNHLISGDIKIDRVLSMMREVRLSTIAERIELYAELGYPAFKSADGYSVSGGWSADFDEKGSPKKKNAWAVLSSNSILGTYDNREQAMQALRERLSVEPEKSERSVKLDLYKVTSTGDIVIGKKVASNKFIDLKTGFKSAREARAYLKDHEAELLQLLEQRKKFLPTRRSTNDPRVGKDYRLGEDATPEKFAAEFGFRGVQFGNYVEQARRVKDLNNAYDALLDLANIIGVQPRAISLNGSLGLAFGARGKGGVDPAAAHYEPSETVINLTKINGAGSLGHEFFHALDNYFSKKRGSAESFVTVSQKGGGDLRPEVAKAFADLMKEIKASEFYKRSIGKDKTRSKDYWSTSEELAARAFESYLIAKAEEKGESNDYLANIISEDAQNVYNEMLSESGMETDPYPYPTKAEQKSINAAFDNLFNTLETKETDKGVALYSKADTAQPDPFPRDQAESRIKSILGDKLGKVLIDSGIVTLVDTEQGLRNLNGAKYMVAWHGSPHDHNKFDSSKIGTGEGAQAYGYGLYFAGSRDVAEYYKETLTNRDAQGYANAHLNAKNLVDRFNGDAEWAAEVVSDQLRNTEQFDQNYGRLQKTLEFIKSGAYAKPLDNPGKLYQVELAPSENEFLDWDKPLSEQSEFVKDALRSGGASNHGISNVLRKFTSGGTEYSVPSNLIEEFTSAKNIFVTKDAEGNNGSNLYYFLKQKAFQDLGAESYIDEAKIASDYLHSIGIRGIRYLDGSSRSAGEGNSNYVIFSDDDVAITAKYAKENGGIQGATFPDGRIALVLENLNASNFDGIFAHEGFHSTIKELVGQETYAKLMKQLENMHAMGRGAQWVKDANAAIPSDTKAEHRIEELAAYAIERYVNGAKQPNIIKRWVESLLSALRTAIIQRMPNGKLKLWAIGNLKAEDLANLAIAGLKAKAQGQLQAQGREAMAFSRNENGANVSRMADKDTVAGTQAPTSAGDGLTGNANAVDSYDDSDMRIKSRSLSKEAASDVRIARIIAQQKNLPEKARKQGYYDYMLGKPNGVGDQSKMLSVSYEQGWNKGATTRKFLDARNMRWVEHDKYRDSGKWKWAIYDEGIYARSGEAKSETNADRDIEVAIAEIRDARTSQNEPSASAGSDVQFSKINQTDTPAFKKWFGNSKVVDADGRPLVVYHGTTRDFTAFDQSTLGEKTGAADARAGFFFAGNPRAADQFTWEGGEKSGHIMPVYLSMQNPFVSSHALNGATGTAAGRIINEAKANGHDGVIFENSDMLGNAGPTYVVFRPEQIKSAIGNNGDFDATNPDIRYSRAQIIGDSGRQYDQTQRQFFKNVGRDIDKKNLVERTTEYLKNDFWKKMAVGIVDQFRGLRDLGDNGQAYMLARLSKGTAGAFDALLHHGKLSIRDGVYDADTSGGFIERLGVPLHGELDDFLWYVAANRAEGLSRLDRENLFTPADIAAGKSLARGQTNFDYTIQTGPQQGTTTRNRTLIYADANRVFNEFQKNTLDMAEQSGLIDSASRKLWESEFYVPFYRVSEEDGEFIGAKMGNALVRQQAFKKLKGGTDKLNSDLLSNTLLNWSHLIEASAKNRAAKASLTAAESIGAAHKAYPGEKKTVWYMDGGQKQEYGVDDPFVMTAITSLEYAGMRNGVMDVMSKFKHWLTVGVTASPAFKVRNLIRDSIQAIGSSDLSYNPIKNVAEGFKQTKRDSQEYVSALAGGGLIRFGTMLEGSESSRVRQLIKSGVKDSTILNSENKWRAFYDQYIDPAIAAYNELGNRSEEINRAALYNQLIKQGKSHAEASLMARDLMDFSMQGSFNTIRFLTQVVPFMNARLQGMYKLGRAVKDNPRKMAVVTGAVALASIALMLGYDDDEDWRRREDWDRNNFWWFKLGGVEFRIPKPFEVGAIGTLAERSVELMMNDEMTGERFRNNINSLLMNNLSMNPVPQAFKPILDLYANIDSFTGRPIESMGMERLDPTMRFNSNTSMVARGLSTASMGAMSPVQIDHLTRAYFGWIGSFVIGGADMAARSVSNEPTKPALDYFKFATQGILKETGTGQSRYVTQMYEQAKELEQAHATYRQLLKDGKTSEAAEYMADNKDKLSRYKQVEGVKRVASKMNEQIRHVERSDMDAQTKKDAIDRIQKQKEIIAKRISPGVQ